MPVGGGGGGTSDPVEPTSTNAIDEIPVGSSSGQQMMEQQPVEVDHSGTPADRQKSKNWLVRQKLYEEMTDAYKSATDPKSECFHEQCGNWKKYIQEENNPMGMESLLNCLSAYIDRCDPKILAASQIDLIKSLIEKCLTHSKPTVRQKSSDCLISLFEVTEVFDETTNDALLEMIKHKNAKVSLASTQALISLLGAYGPKKVQLKGFTKSMEDAAGSTTPATKAEGLNFFKECYRWLGDGPLIDALIKNLKQQQIDFLKEEFAKLKEEGKKRPKLTRSEQKKAKEQQLDGIISNQLEEEKGNDPGLDLFEAVNILQTYNSDWIAKFMEKKWNDRKTDLDALYEACNQPKISSGDFQGIVEMIKSQLKDAMVPVSIAATKISGILAEKLKKDFEPFAKQLVVPIIYRFKEKKTNIMEACHQALESFLNCVNIEQIKDDLISTGLLDKPSTTDKSLQVTPSMKKNTCVFLEKAAQQTYIDVLQRVSADFLSALIKLSDDPDAETRAAGLQVLGIFKGRLGEAAMSNYLKDMIPQKLAKVNESAKTVQPSKYDRPEVKQPDSVPKSQAAKKPVAKAQKMEGEVIVPKAKNQFDEMPIGGNKGASNEDERPLGSAKAGYNLDNLNSDAFGDSLNVSENKPKGKVPARFAQKKVESSQQEEKPVLEDERPLPKAAPVNMDDLPISSKQQAGDTPNEDEDRPIPKGSYNLDNLPADAFGGDDAFTSQPAKPVRKPPAKFANKSKPSVAQTSEPMTDDVPIKPAKVVNMDDMPIGSSKQGDVPISEGDPEEKPLPRGAYNLDALGDDAFGGPPPSSSGPKKPTARFAAKKPNEDEEMKDETVVSAPKKPAPPKAAASKAKEETKAAPKAATKANPAQEEGAGEGLSKEEAIAKVEETFAAEAIENLGDDKKWNEKVLGFQAINQAIAQMQPDAVIIEAVVKYTKIKLKDWKESNINLIKESIALFTTISTSCEKLGKRAVFVMMSFLSDKLGDVKMLNSVNELLLSLSETVTPKYVALQLVKYGSQAKAPNVIKETCNILTRLTDEFGFVTMPVKETIDFALVAVNNSNPQVRTASMALFAMLYKHAGETVKTFIKDVKESTMKLIDDELKKVTVYGKGEYQRKRNFKGEAAFEEKATAGPGKKGAAGGGGLDDLFPRADISKLLTPKLMPLFGDNDWKKRKEAADKVEEILKASNMRIQPVGLNELMDKIKQRMTDANKAVCKAFIQLICLLVEALGPNAKQYAKKLLPPMMQNLADKQSLVRADTITAMDKWAKECGAELIITIGGPMVSQDNPELRTEMLGWIIRNKDSIKLVAPEALKECCKPLVECLSDKTNAIRQSAEEVITEIMPLTGYAAFQSVLSNLKPAVQQSIKPILEKVKSKVGDILIAPPQTQMMQSFEPPSQKPAEKAAPVSGPTLKPQIAAQVAQKPQIKPKEQAPALVNQSDNKMNQSLNSSLSQKQLVTQTPQSKQQSLMKGPSTNQQLTGPRLKQNIAQGVSNFKTNDQQSDGSISQQESITINFGQKDKRGEWDRRNKFHIEDFKQDQIEKLKTQSQFAFGSSFSQKLYSQDFKQHNECIDQFSFLMQNQPESILEVLDLIFKWTALRLADSGNTQFGVKIFDFFAQLFSHIQSLGYQLLDFEIAVLVPLLCEKSGMNSAILKDKAKKLLRMSFDICDKQLCYNYVISHGLQSKNQNSVAECLDEIAEFIIKNGIDYSSEKEMRFIAKMADAPSKNVRENALKVLGEAYKHLDDNIWRVLGDVTTKVRGLLEARFKKIKGVPAPINHLYASASVASFQTARPQTAMNTNESSLGFKPSQGLQAVPQQKTGLRGPAQATTARNTAVQRPGTSNKLQSSYNQFQPEQQEIEVQMQQMTLDQQNPVGQQMKMEDLQPVKQHSSLASKLKPLAQVSQQQVVAQPPLHHQTLLQAPEDDDEDLRMFANDMNLLDSQSDPLLEDIRRHIHFMKYADLTKKVDSLVSINEIICNMNEQSLIVVQKAANDLIGAYVQMMNDVFECPVESINYRFTKYFMTVVIKTCSIREIMSHCGYEQVFALTQQLLTRLLIDGLDQIGDNKEGEIILKSLNTSMLKILENCNHTYIFCALINFQTKIYHEPRPKLSNIIVKCLLKLSKIIEKLVNNLDVSQLLVAVHEYLLVINHENKSPIDEMGIKTAKSIINEIIKIKRDSIWQDYASVQQHHNPDQHLHKWIQVILRSFSTGIPASSNIPPSAMQVDQQNSQKDPELVAILNQLRIPDRYDHNLPQLYSYLRAKPEVNLDDYLGTFSQAFRNILKKSLEDQARKNKFGEISQEPQDEMQFDTQSANSIRNPKHIVRDFMEDQVPRWSHHGPINQGNAGVMGQSGFQGMRQSLPVLSQPPSNIGIGSQGESQNQIERLQNLKERMNLMKKGGTAGNTPTDNITRQTEPNAGNANGGGLNTSFSAMNNNLSLKWQAKQNQMQKSRPGAEGGLAAHLSPHQQPQLGSGGQAMPNQQQIAYNTGADHNNGQLDQSHITQGNPNSMSMIQPQAVPRAQPSDLNNRLAEMKAKLAALKNQKQ